jgi:hypothetical protein
MNHPRRRTDGTSHDRWRALLAPTLAIALLISQSAFGAAVPLGAEFQVNSYTALDQYGARVSVNPAGNAVVVWDSLDQDGESSGTFAQRYDSGGTRLGTEFQVSTATVAFQFSADVASAADGSFLVAWEFRDASLDLGIAARRFDSAGNPLGPEAPVNLHLPGNQAGAGVASGANGNGVVVWHSFGSQDGSGLGVFGRRIDSMGNPVGAEFQVNSYTPGDQSGQVTVGIGADAAGNFVVAWQSLGQDGSLDGVFAQRFSSTATRLGTEFQVNTHTVDRQRVAQVATAANGDFVVAWTSYQQDGSNRGVFAQRFASNGGRLGTEFQVNTYTQGDQGSTGLAVSAAPDGDFVVAWKSYAQDGSDYGIFAQRFASTGSRLGTELQVNTFTPGEQRSPAVASTNGQFIVTWESDAQDGDGSGVFAQRFDAIAACGNVPRSGCRAAGKSLLLMKDNANDAGDKIVWKWVKGDATTQDDFGDPRTTTDYALCVYAGTAAGLVLVDEARVGADGSLWDTLSDTGYKYKDSAGSQAGVQKVLLKGGGQGHAKELVKGKGTGLPDPTLGSLPFPVRAQLLNSDTGICWESTFNSAIDNDANQFKAKVAN